MSRVAEKNSRDYRRILIIKPSSLGDIVHTLPVLAGLRRPIRAPTSPGWSAAPSCRSLKAIHSSTK
jgi:ADP-heptose:LPS heptosyltransferase